MSRPHNAPDVFRALADPTRRRILDLLRQRDRSPAELIAITRASGQSMTHHLKALRHSGLVSFTRAGRSFTYRLAPTPLRRARAWLVPYDSRIRLPA